MAWTGQKVEKSNDTNHFKLFKLPTPKKRLKQQKNLEQV
jgi:hypothetical protein